MKNCCNVTSSAKKCVRKTDKKIFSLPRRFSRKKCASTPRKGFTMRSSCAPYKGCGGKKVSRKTKKRRKPRSLQKRRKNKRSRSKRMVAGASPYSGVIFEKYDDVTIDHVLDPTQLEVGIDLFELINNPRMSANRLSDLTESIVTDIQNLNVEMYLDPDSTGEPKNYTINFLIMMLSKIDPSELLEIENLNQEVAGIYIHEIQRVRTALLEKLRSLRYPVYSISTHFDIDTSNIQKGPTRPREYHTGVTDDTTDPFFSYSSVSQY